MRRDANLFHKRMMFIRRQLDGEIEPVPQVSRDHSRTNRNGLRLDVLEEMGGRPIVDGGFGADGFVPPSALNPFKADRRSVDGVQQSGVGPGGRRYTPQSKRGLAKFEHYAQPGQAQYTQRKVTGQASTQHSPTATGEADSRQPSLNSAKGSRRVPAQHNASLASLLNDKALVYNRNARGFDGADGGLPTALG